MCYVCLCGSMYVYMCAWASGVSLCMRAYSHTHSPNVSLPVWQAEACPGQEMCHFRNISVPGLCTLAAVGEGKGMGGGDTLSTGAEPQCLGREPRQSRRRPHPLRMGSTPHCARGMWCQDAVMATRESAGSTHCEWGAVHGACCRVSLGACVPQTCLPAGVWACLLLPPLSLRNLLSPRGLSHQADGTVSGEVAQPCPSPHSKRVIFWEAPHVWPLSPSRHCPGAQSRVGAEG